MGSSLLLISPPKCGHIIIPFFSIVRRSTIDTQLPIVPSNLPKISSPSAPIRPLKGPECSSTVSVSQSPSSGGGEEEENEPEEVLVQDLRVPDCWLLPSKALEESNWLRVALHKWLDDEYCPEETNVEISRVAAQSYYESLLKKQTDLGEILLKMARELESISYQESFHGHELARRRARFHFNFTGPIPGQDIGCLVWQNRDQSPYGYSTN